MHLQVRQIITDDQSRGLVEAFQKFRNTDQEHTAQELAEYKSRAEKDIIGLEENIYGFTFVSIDDEIIFFLWPWLTLLCLNRIPQLGY